MLEILNEKNYAAQVIRVPKPFPLPNADRLVGLGIFGYTVITAKDGDIREGDLAVFFPAEAQISHDLVSFANLYRHSELNADPNEVGYIEDNRRVRALKLRGTVSNGLLLPVAVVEKFAGTVLSEGDTFDHIDGIEISRKFRVKEPVVHDRSAAKIKKAFKRVDEALFPEHIETDQWLRNDHLVQDDEILVVTQKLHGSSVRIGRTLVRNELTWLEKLARKLGVRVQETSFDYLAGSRKVIKDPKSTTQNHYYKEDIWSEMGSRFESQIPENVIVYGEIVGWTNDGAPIQKGHTYGVPKGERDLFVYRVSIITDTGALWDLSWDQVRYFCDTHGFQTVPELWRGRKSEFLLELFEEKDFHKEWSKGIKYAEAPLPLDKDGTGADEGIAIRVDRFGQVPALFKYKNASFYLYETKTLDSGEVDIESDQS